VLELRLDGQAYALLALESRLCLVELEANPVDLQPVTAGELRQWLGPNPADSTVVARVHAIREEGYLPNQCLALWLDRGSDDLRTATSPSIRALAWQAALERLGVGIRVRPVFDSPDREPP
jgi:hypothetical protein